MDSGIESDTTWATPSCSPLITTLSSLRSASLPRPGHADGGNDCSSSMTATEASSSPTAGRVSMTASMPLQGRLTALRCVKPLQAAAPAFQQANKRDQLTGRFDPELIDALPKSLRYIAHNGAGYDQIDVDACTLKGLACRPRTRHRRPRITRSYRHIRLKYSRSRRRLNCQHSAVPPPRGSSADTCALDRSPRRTMAWSYGAWSRSRR